VAGEATAGTPAAITAAAAPQLGYLVLLVAATAPLVIGIVLWRRWYRLRGEPPVPPFSPPFGLGLFIMMFVLGAAGAAVARRVVLGDAPDDSITDVALAGHARILIGTSIGQAVVVAAYLWVCAGRSRPRRLMGLGTSAVVGAVTLVALWPVMSGASFVLGALARAIQQEPIDPIAHDTLRQLVESPADAWLVVMSLLVILVAPVLEEVTYRGILQRTIIGLDFGRYTAILITSCVFVFMHLTVARWHALPALFVLSLGFGWVYERTGRLAAPIVMHVLFNALNLGLAWWTVSD